MFYKLNNGNISNFTYQKGVLVDEMGTSIYVFIYYTYMGTL